MKQERPEVDRPTLFAVALVIAVGGLIYELILGTAASYLVGDSITSFSLSIGITLFGMGLGSFAAITFQKNSIRNFILTEICLSILGGNAVVLLFAAFSMTGLFWFTFIALSIAIGFLIGLEIPLVVSMAKEYGSERNVTFLSKIMGLDYIGALVGSLLFPFLMLPTLGLTRTAYAVALFNSSIALFILWRVKLLQRQRIWLLGAAILASLGLFVGFRYSSDLEESLNARSFQDPVVYYEFTPYQRITFTAYKDDVRLYLNNQLQFSTIDEARYHETLVHSALRKAPSIENVLVLGGGEGLAVRELVKYDEVKTITVVDIDPAITDLSTELQLLREINDDAMADSRVSIVNDDAFIFARDATQTYDVILSDLVDPSSEKTAKLYSKEMYKSLSNMLAPGGVFTTQSSSTFFTPSAFWMIKNSVEAGFETEASGLFVNVPTFGEWSFLTIGGNSVDTRSLPNDISYVTPEFLDAASAAPTNLVKHQHDDINTLFSPKIHLRYSEDMDQWRF